MSEEPPMDETLAVLREHGFYDFPTPWSNRAADECAKQGPWADYAGWENWMSVRYDNECSGDINGALNQEGCDCHQCRMAEWWEELDVWERAELYATMSDACAFTAVALGWRPEQGSKECQ